MGVFITLAALALIAYLFYRWSVATYDYFEKRGVPFLRPKPLVGSLWPVFSGQKHAMDAAQEGYWVFPEARFSGFFMFRKPGYLIHDPELIKQITIKDFDHFTDHANNITPELDPFLGRSLFFAEGHRWKPGRTGLSPAFTGSKMRNMMVLLYNYLEGAMERLKEDANGGKFEKEMKDFFQRLGNDVTTSISFGVEVDSFRDPDNQFLEAGKLLTATDGLQGFKFFLITFFPEKLFTALNIRVTPQKVAEFYEEAVSKSIKHREENNIVRPDFIHLLLQARKNELKEDHNDDKFDSAGFSTVQEHLQAPSGTAKSSEWTDLDIAAAAASFFFGGIETTTVFLSFTIYELALNPDIQDKLRAEIDATTETLNGKNLSYEAMQQMKYLDQVVTEALRRWTSFGITNRKCVKEYTFENSDGTKVTIEKGTLIQIPMAAIHLDAKYYPNPLRFDPERFSEENRHQLNPNAYMPFGMGPRNCIGSRLALMQAKCFLFYILKHFTVEISQKTDVPIQIDKRSVGVKTLSGIWVYLTPRS
ncbi:probable cytochrome P450 9f2 [Uranotaenia lowii]|uniref:probable cytochrome P450 9f2 n=1 Tax=Uranotaenia lowii TaxID=190385 RepID=UPI002479F904|nr:probable cytochrome P450 9f2 [Uranotaenia lowii]